MFFILQGATHKVVIGPVVAVANGYVPVTTLALTTADEAEVILHDNGTVVDISAYTFAAITTADGYYHLTLQSGISGTVGHMTVVINDDSLCLPVKADFTVIEEAVYDALYAASATGVPAAGALEATLTTMQGATFSGTTDSLEALRDRGDAAWITATGFATPTNITAASGVTLSATGSAALTEGYAADGAAATLPQLLYLLVAYLTEKNISGTTLTAKKLDGSTAAATFTLDSATAPTSITRAT